MAEVLALVSLPEILSAAYAFITYAISELDAVEERHSQCKLILDRCTSLIDEIAKHNATGTLPDSFHQNSAFIESACKATYAAIHELSGRHFLWRITHKAVIDDVIKSAEEAIATAYMKFNIGAQADAYRFHQELLQIQNEERIRMNRMFEQLMQRPNDMIVELQKDGGRTLRIEELAVSLTKYIQHNQGITARTDDPANKFLVSATSRVQQLSGIQQTTTIPEWSVTTMEVHIDRKEPIGRGGFGVIYRGEWNGEIVAVKEMHQDDARVIDRQKIKAVQREISIWSTLRNPHILAFYGACLEAVQPFILTQLCNHGNVLDYIERNPGADRLRLLHETSLGMVYLHDKRVIHSDLKAANILISDDGKVLIADFGLSRLQDQVSSKVFSNFSPDSSPAGSLRWMSPEKLRGDVEDFPSDVYSFAMTAWEVYSGQVPFALMSNALILAKVRDNQERPERPALLTNDHLWELVKLCWDADPSKRPSFKTIQSRLKHLTISVPSIHFSTPITPIPPSPSPLSAPLLTPFSSQLSGHRRKISDPLEPLRLGGDDKSIDLPPRTPLQPSLDINNAPDSQSSLLLDIPYVISQLQHGVDILASVTRLESLTHDDQSRGTLTYMPEFYAEIEKLLRNDSSDTKELAAACLMNITWDEAGRRALVNYPNLLPPLVRLLWQGSSTAKQNAARCINRLATLADGQALVLRQDDIILSLSHLLHQWSSTKEKEQSAKCFASLSCINAGQRAIIAESNVVPNLLNALPHCSTDARQNITRSLANLATNADCAPKLLNQSPLIPAIRSLLTPDTPPSETEQAIRCLQYIANLPSGQAALVNDTEFLNVLPPLLTHEATNVKKHAVACLNAANRLFLQRSLAYNLKSVLLTSPPDVKRYAAEAFQRTMDNCVRADVRLQSIPFRHDRQSFLFAVEELIQEQRTEQISVRCLGKLCSDVTDPECVHWMLELRHRPALLLSLSKLTYGDPFVQQEAARCLLAVSTRIVGNAAAFVSTQGLLSELAKGLKMGTPEAKLCLTECLNNLAKSGGKEALQQHTLIVQALSELNRSQLTHSDIRAQAALCLQALDISLSGTKRISIFRRFLA
ncbi:hypothetical protein ONZ45_g2067 [Pleurotus djamor]|nr:hypothetical protein ONZ45_g2067 [Pleurotus djamor]